MPKVKAMKYAFILMLFSTAALGANTATLTWTAPTTNADSTPITGAITYSIYASVQGSAPTGAALVTGLTTLTDAISTGLADGTTDCFNVTAGVAGQQSAYSNQVCKTFPAGTPNAPVLTVS